MKNFESRLSMAEIQSLRLAVGDIANRYEVEAFVKLFHLSLHVFAVVPAVDFKFTRFIRAAHRAQKFSAYIIAVALGHGLGKLLFFENGISPALRNVV